MGETMREKIARMIWRETGRHQSLMEWHEIKRGGLHHKHYLAAADAVLAEMERDKLATPLSSPPPSEATG